MPHHCYDGPGLVPLGNGQGLCLAVSRLRSLLATRGHPGVSVSVSTAIAPSPPSARRPCVHQTHPLIEGTATPETDGSGQMAALCTAPLRRPSRRPPATSPCTSWTEAVYHGWPVTHASFAPLHQQLMHPWADSHDQEGQSEVSGGRIAGCQSGSHHRLRLRHQSLRQMQSLRLLDSTQKTPHHRFLWFQHTVFQSTGVRRRGTQWMIGIGQGILIEDGTHSLQFIVIFPFF